MKDRQACEQYLEKNENRHTRVYDDKTGKPPVTPGVFIGKPTIGVGFNLNKNGAKEAIEGLGVNYQDLRNGKVELSDHQINELFKRDTDIAINDAKQFSNKFDSLDSMRQIVLVDMAFNMGSGKLSDFTKLRDAIEANNPEKMLREILDSKYASDVGDRAVRNATAMQTSKMPYSEITLNSQHTGHGPKSKETSDKGKDHKDGKDSSDKGKDGKDSSDKGKDHKDGKDSSDKGKDHKEGKDGKDSSDKGKDHKDGKDSSDKGKDHKEGKDSSDKHRDHSAMFKDHTNIANKNVTKAGRDFTNNKAELLSGSLPFIKSSQTGWDDNKNSNAKVNLQNAQPQNDEIKHEDDILDRFWYTISV